MNVFKKELSLALLQTSVLKSPKQRVTYALNTAKQFNKYIDQVDKMYSDITSKLAEAGLVITRYDDWIDCIVESMGDLKDEIMFDALKKMNKKYYGDKK